MQYGFVLPRGDSRTAAGQAKEIEAAGWDGFVVWEAVYGTGPWILLAAAALNTGRIRLGTLPIPPTRGS